MAAAKRNNCTLELLMKDISTIANNLENIVRWEQIVMEMVKSY